MLFMLKDWALAISLEQLLRLDLFLERELSWSWHCHRSTDSAVPVMPRGFGPCQILNGHFFLISQVQIFALLHNLHFPLINTRINTAVLFAKDWCIFIISRLFVVKEKVSRVKYYYRKEDNLSDAKLCSYSVYIKSIACRKSDNWQGFFCLWIFKVGERYPAPTQNQRAHGGNLHPLQSLWIMERLPGESLLGAGVMATQGSHPHLANLVNRSFCMLLHTVHSC